MSVNQLLIKAKEVISKPENWTKGEFARLEDGTACNLRRSDAKCFCTLGAIIKIADKERYSNRDKIDAVAEIAKFSPDYRCVPDWNDSEMTTHANVMAAFDKAIEATK